MSAKLGRAPMNANRRIFKVIVLNLIIWVPMSIVLQLVGCPRWLFFSLSAAVAIAVGVFTSVRIMKREGRW